MPGPGVHGIHTDRCQADLKESALALVGPENKLNGTQPWTFLFRVSRCITSGQKPPVASL